jgi:hypothetical protein
MDDKKTLSDRIDDAFYAVCMLIYQGYLKLSKKLKGEDNEEEY